MVSETKWRGITRIADLKGYGGINIKDKETVTTGHIQLTWEKPIKTVLSDCDVLM